MRIHEIPATEFLVFCRNGCREAKGLKTALSTVAKSINVQTTLARSKYGGFLKWGYSQSFFQVSWVMGVPPNHPLIHRIFRFKPSSYWGTPILGTPHLQDRFCLDSFTSRYHLPDSHPNHCPYVWKCSLDPQGSVALIKGTGTGHAPYPPLWMSHGPADSWTFLRVP